MEEFLTVCFNLILISLIYQGYKCESLPEDGVLRTVEREIFWDCDCSSFPEEGVTVSGAAFGNPLFKENSKFCILGFLDHAMRARVNFRYQNCCSVVFFWCTITLKVSETLVLHCVDCALLLRTMFSSLARANELAQMSSCAYKT